MRGNYRGYDIVSMPLPSSGGTVLLETLNILEGFPMADMKQGSAPSLHVMIEAMKRAYADRARYLGDPAFVNAPANVLITKDYAAKQRASIDLARATPRRRLSVRRRAKAATPRIIRSSIPAAMRSATPTR